jgi:cytochrome oxidase Cu insertion factor (SCO1/SenC/PrrC family)
VRSRTGAAITAAIVIALLGATAVAAALAVRQSLSSSPDSATEAPGIPRTVSPQLARFMGLTPLGSPAPGFTLTDQNGRTLSLSAFRGKVVVLQFVDPHCTDICPIVSNEFVKAYHDLGSAASKVVFAAVNVNPYHTNVAAVAAFSREQGLTTIPNWHYFTGSVAQLKKVWREYYVAVKAPNPKADVVHTSVIYFIDPHGKDRYMASPMVDHTNNGTAYLPPKQVRTWGHGIALVAKALLQ